MNKLLFAVATGAILVGSAAHASITQEHYCFPRSGIPFSDGSVWPSVTMMYSGMTLTTTPVTFTLTGVGASGTPALASSSGGQQASQNVGLGPASSGPLDPVASRSIASDRTASFGSTLIVVPSGSISSTRTVGSQALDVTGGGSSAVASVVLAPSQNPDFASGNVNNASSPNQITQTEVPVPPLAKSSAKLSSGGTNSCTTCGSNWVSLGAHSTLMPAIPTGSVVGANTSIADKANVTMLSSQQAIDALQMADFLKNLGKQIFNTSRLSTINRAEQKTDANTTALMEDILKQEQSQSRTIQELLVRSGGRRVPACQYNLSNNLTQALPFMNAFKTMELGVFMSLAEALPTSDTSTAQVLLSITSVDSQHATLLRTHNNASIDMIPFDTPLSATWAYNFALEYVQPGTCEVELPYPILPPLTVNNMTISIVRPGMTVSLSWGVAGQFAAMRSGKPLFVAWTNQLSAPVMSPVTKLGDGFGTTVVPQGLSGTAFVVLTSQPERTNIRDLTEATLAGPAVVTFNR